MDLLNTMVDYIKKNLKMYAYSFKVDKDFLSVLLLNSLFFLSTAGAVKLIEFISRVNMEKMNRIDLSNIAFQTEAQLKSTIASMKGFVLFLIVAAVISVLFTIINWSFFQGIIHSILLKKKFNINFFWKFLILNIIWALPWSILFFIILLGTKVTYFVFIFTICLLLFFHFSFILYLLFTKNNKFSDIKKALKIGTAKIHYFILPYFLIFITFMILSQVALLKLGNIIMLLIFIVFFSWWQYYIKNVILEISERFK